MKIAKKYTNMGIVADILSLKRKVRSAVDFKKLLKLSRLNEKEVKKALKDLKEFGVKIVLTEDNPPRYYWPK